jgi:hypothetical protein
MASSSEVLSAPPCTSRRAKQTGPRFRRAKTICLWTMTQRHFPLPEMRPLQGHPKYAFWNVDIYLR